MMLLTFCFSSLLLLVKADTSVHILSKYGHGQLVTSSILTWIQDIHYSASKNFVIGGFEIVSSETGEGSEPLEKMNRPIFVCRAMHNGIWVAGGQQQGEKRCNVTLTSNVGSYERYQLLENVDKAARISWENWTKLYQTPVGAVATGKLYVARHVVNEPGRKQTHYIGTLNSQDTLGAINYVQEDGTEGTADNGQVLVETEPISYELNAVKLNQQRRREVKRTARVLGEATISNTGSSPANMAEAFGYSYNYMLSWGQVHAMLKGLSTTVTLFNKTRLPDLSWGIETRENRAGVYTVEVYLEAGTAVNVSLRGVDTEVEVPYSGRLLSHYEDGVSTDARPISGMRREESIGEIAPEFGPIYYLSNLSLVPTTPAPPSTEPTTSTTPLHPTTTPTSQQQQTERFELDNAAAEEQQYSKESASFDENAILAKQRPEATGMQGDDGGPLSLKDKAEHSAAPRPAATLCALPLLLATSPLLAALLLHRVT